MVGRLSDLGACPLELTPMRPLLCETPVTVQRESYYVPNRILWPVCGLDLRGPHTCVLLTASALWEAAQTGTIPFEDARDERQWELRS